MGYLVLLSFLPPKAILLIIEEPRAGKLVELFSTHLAQQ